MVECALLAWLEDGADKAFDAIKEISHGEKVSASNIFFAIQFLVGIDNTFQIVGTSEPAPFSEYLLAMSEWVNSLAAAIRCSLPACFLKIKIPQLT